MRILIVTAQLPVELSYIWRREMCCMQKDMDLVIFRALLPWRPTCCTGCQPKVPFPCVLQGAPWNAPSSVYIMTSILICIIHTLYLDSVTKLLRYLTMTILYNVYIEFVSYILIFQGLFQNQHVWHALKYNITTHLYIYLCLSLLKLLKYLNTNISV